MNVTTMANSKNFKYQNTSDEKLAIMGIGEVEAGQFIESDQPIHNPNLKLVDAGRMVNVEAPTEQPKISKTLKG